MRVSGIDATGAHIGPLDGQFDRWSGYRHKLFALSGVLRVSATDQPPTGRPVIEGQPRVEAVLSAETDHADSPIADANGLATPSYTYQWLRGAPDAAEPSPIAGATASTYTLVGADAGNKISAHVTLTDDSSNTHTLTSTAFPTSGTILAQASCPAPTYAANEEELATFSFTVVSDTGGGGFVKSGLSPAPDTSIAVDATTTRTVEKLTESFDDAKRPTLHITFDSGGLTPAQIHSLTLYVCDRRIPLVQGSPFGATIEEDFFRDTPPFLDTYATRTVRITRDVTVPILQSIEHYGRTITLTYSEQLSTRLIAPASRFSVTVNGAPAALRISNPVRVVGNRLILTLAADADYGAAVTVAYVAGTGNRIEDPSRNPAAVFTARTAMSVNSPPSGRPGIHGVPREGGPVQGITVWPRNSPNTINDPDGLSNRTFTYQWLRTDADGNGGAPIAGATQRTYTLGAGDVGHRVRMRLYFTDDRSNAEQLTSAAFPSNGTVLAEAPCIAPQLSGGAHIVWQAALRPATSGAQVGFNKNFPTDGTLQPRTFNTGNGTDITVNRLTQERTGLSPIIYFDLSRAPSTTEHRQLTLHVCDADFRFSARQGNPGEFANDPTFSWSLPEGNDDIIDTHAERTVYISRDDDAPTLSSVRRTVEGAELRYSETLDTTSIPAAGAFTVRIDGTPAALAARNPVSIDGSAVRLTLAATPVRHAHTSVDYTAPSSGNTLRDRSRNAAASFVGRATQSFADGTPNDQLLGNTTIDGQHNHYSGVHAIAQLFRTGTHQGVYRVDYIDIISLGSSRFRASLCETTINSRNKTIPDESRCTALTPPSNLGTSERTRNAGNARLTFDAPSLPGMPAGVRLQPDTAYAIRVRPQASTISTEENTVLPKLKVNYSATARDTIGHASGFANLGAQMNRTPSNGWGNENVKYSFAFSLRGALATGGLISAGQNEAVRAASPPRLLSNAGADGAWTAGETVEVALAFNEAVTVDTTNGTPSISLDLGGTQPRSALYTRGSGSAELVFAYTLTDADGSHTSVVLPPDSLATNGGTIRSAANSADADLSHAGAAILAPPAQQGAQKESPQQDKQAAFTASFESLPEHHDGSTPFTFELRFSEVAVTSWRTVAGGILDVSGAEVTRARRLAPNGADRNRRWEVTVAPTQAGSITITLPVRACSEAKAVCANGQPLAQAVSATVPRGSITAAFSQMPDDHDGETAFTFELHFSAAPQLSYRTVQGALFLVVGGSVTKARRLTPGSNLGWEVRVVPGSDGDITLLLPPTLACTDAAAVCTSDGRVLSSGLAARVLGPATARHLIGSAADDNLEGWDGDDTLEGGSGDDTLYGDGGDDMLVGGSGDDILTGGPGGDTFVFAAGHGTDTITDFTLDEDVMDLSELPALGGFAALSITTDDTDARIDLRGHQGGVIWLEDVAASDLEAGDFVLP